MFCVYTKKNIVVEIPFDRQESIYKTKSLEEPSSVVNQENSHSEYISFFGGLWVVFAGK